MKKIGIIGCGHISDTHIRSWKKAKDSEVIAVFDINKSLAESKAAKYSIGKVYTDMDEMISVCDVLDVCTPPKTHFDIALKIIKQGKHLLIEKPLVTDVQQWEQLKESLAYSNTKLAVLHNLKFTSAVLKGKKIIQSGELGEVIRINRYFLTHPQHDRMLVGNSHWSHQLPGGRWFETMPHELYLTHYYSGKSEIDNITVLHTDKALSGAPADEVCITMRNEKCITNFHYSSNCLQNKRYIEVIGTKATLVIDILSDMIFLDNVSESKRRRAVGIMLMEAASRIAQSIPNRIQYMKDRTGGISPHTRIILQFDQYLEGKAESPTPLEEIDYVVHYCDKVGRAIEDKLQQTTLV